jgi:hypothetical protein
LATVLTWLRRVLVGAAAACLLLFGALLVFEESGLLARMARERLARELGPLGERLTIEHARLAWFEPGIEIVGLALASPEPAGASDIELDRLHATFSPRLDELRGVRIEGGRALLGPRLFDEWNQLAALRAQRVPADVARMLPPASIEGLLVALELFDRSSLELGTLDLCARPASSGGVELAGSLAPSLAGAIAAADPIRVNGALSPQAARLWASARDLALEARALPAGALSIPLPIAEGSARLTLDSEFELSFAEAARPRGRLRASLAQGRLRLTPGGPPFEELALELDVMLAPEPGADPWTPGSWDGRAALVARVRDTPLWAHGEVGRGVPDGGWLHAWGRAQDVRVDREALESLGLEEPFAFVRRLLAPGGRGDLAAEIFLGREAGAWTRDLALYALADGAVQLEYGGFPDDPKSGLSVPLTGVRGELVLGERTGAARHWRLSAYDLAGEHGSGHLRGWAQVTAPERSPGAYAHPEVDLVLSTPSRAVDAPLLRALSQNHYLEWIVPDFAPENGTLACEFRLRSGPELKGTSGAGRLRLRGVSLRWRDVPVPMDGVDGEIAFLWGREPSVAADRPHLTRRPFGVDYRLDNRAGPRVGAQARVAGWVREEALPAVFDPAAPLPEPLQEIRIDIDELGLRGRDFDVLAARFPALEREVLAYGAVGRMRVRFRGEQSSPSTPFRSAVEATPIAVHVRPQFFQRLTRDLRGRVLIQSEESPQGNVNAAQFVLAGGWPGGVELFAHGAIPASGEARVSVFGAGIDPTNTSFKGALITTLSTGSPTAGGIDFSSWTLAGPLDFALETSFDPASAAPARNRYRIQLRDNDFSAQELRLGSLHGTLEQEDEVMTSARVEATLGGHPLELRDLRSFPLAVLPRVAGADPWLTREGFWKDPNGRALQADLHTRDMPLDEQRLAGLLEPEALEALRANPSWRGAIDVLGARLVVTNEAGDRGKIALRGAMRPHDLRLQFGLPILVDTARVSLEELVQESGRLRGWAHISGLNAFIAERELSDARMIAGYVDGRLTIDNLSGDFEGGRLESLGGALGGTSKALGIDLAEPHRFDVAVGLTQVGVGGLLRGVFQSSIADEGILDASLQLSGTPGEILALTGRGSLSLDEGALWSVPVMRELLARLGFDKSGLFDRLRSRFDVRDGRITVSHLEIRSALLDLVGAGWQDMDGRLSYDLEVRYGLLDRLGPVGRLLYWLNNNLMRVAVRGDFERPEIKIRNSILELFTGFDEAPPRHLPLPAFSTLRPRF